MKHLLLGLGMAMFGVMTAQAAAARVWTDSQGRKVEAAFVKLDGDTVYIQLANGTVFPLPLARLSPADQEAARTLTPAENANALLSVPTNASVAQAAAKIDQLVEIGLQKGNIKLAEQARKKALEDQKSGVKPKPHVAVPPNPLMTDEQFVRRVYLDIAGRIPNFDEATAFLKDASAEKRAKLIDTLLASDGYASHLYNYFAEMLRIKEGLETADYVTGTPYIQWMKDQIKANTTWDKMVYDMITADGKAWNNGATGYLLRDSGMRLDNLAVTLTVFLGTDVACAQCHDHPFANWTQRQFYEMASFFGATSTYMGNRDFPNGDPTKHLAEEADRIMQSNGLDPKIHGEIVRDVMGANKVVIKDVPENRIRLPHDYKYKDGKPNEPVAPKLIMWSEKDKKNPSYDVVNSGGRKGRKDDGAANTENLRESFARWMTHPANPRFSMTIANRMWAHAFGLALTPSVRSMDHPEEAYNPELLLHLSNEMVRVKFNLKEFLRILYNTKTYQREATTTALAMGEPYYFQGPVLRRMSAEQAWDSYMTLVMGSPDSVKNQGADLYGRSLDMNLATVDVKTVLLKANAVRDISKKLNANVMTGGLAMAGSDDSMMEGKVLRYGKMKLMRASELEQPAPDGHFLRDFGQSDRMLIDGGAKEGSVPQVLMMMNGPTQAMLTSKDSLIFRNMEKVSSPADKVEAMFLSILNRRPTLREKDIAKKQLSAHGEDGYSNMIWALINTREFSFIQ
ncbi:DUF1549 domain-containing protein [Verrucomicrobium spinosum]|uniref:DUF1549 domain-containing protein n=1 Tax=Verrucomicrobium spinosum TaxID=2736 RepID=UPI001E55E9FA|nr:DUF1549 domain-containing protein [Verrucomicrobium spinosum]